MNTALIFFILLHWSLVLFDTTYVFFRTSTKYDMVYFVVICTVIASWQVTKHECLISYWEKLAIDPNYVFNSDATNSPFVTLIFSKPFVPFVWTLIFFGTAYNLYTMMRIYDVPLPILITMLFFLFVPIIKARI